MKEDGLWRAVKWWEDISWLCFICCQPGGMEEEAPYLRSPLPHLTLQTYPCVWPSLNSSSRSAVSVWLTFFTQLTKAYVAEISCNQLFIDSFCCVHTCSSRSIHWYTLWPNPIYCELIPIWQAILSALIPTASCLKVWKQQWAVMYRVYLCGSVHMGQTEYILTWGHSFVCLYTTLVCVVWGLFAMKYVQACVCTHQLTILGLEYLLTKTSMSTHVLSLSIFQLG